MKTQQRDDLVIATKVRGNMGSGPNDEGLSRKHILSGVESSLRRLATDYIDLYQIHQWDSGTLFEETLSTLNSLVQVGKVRYIGASNLTGWQLQKAIDLCKQMGWEVFSCLQPLYNLLDRSIEYEILPVCQNEGVGVIPWSPLRGGWLSGKFRRGMTAPPEGTRIDTAEKMGWGEAWRVYDNEHTWQVIDTLCSVGEKIGKTPAQVALKWVLERPGVTAPIIGARSLAQLEDNLGSVGWILDDESMARLIKASDLPLPYPYKQVSEEYARRKHTNSG
jgi:aryl-alcohol dehydrogenase-like predicted oxidoreductase